MQNLYLLTCIIRIDIVVWQNGLNVHFTYRKAVQFLPGRMFLYLSLLDQLTVSVDPHKGRML